MALHLYLGDITKMRTDAIVNAANTDLRRCPGICEAIFSAARQEELEKACKDIGHCPIGRAVITPSCGLPSKYIIHVAGPGWYGGARRERFLMASCYQNALQKAFVYGCKSVAFPLIFSGDCHIPRPDSIRIAGQVIQEFIDGHKMEVYLVLYKESIYRMAQMILRPTSDR